MMNVNYFSIVIWCFLALTILYFWIEFRQTTDALLRRIATLESRLKQSSLTIGHSSLSSATAVLSTHSASFVATSFSSPPSPQSVRRGIVVFYDFRKKGMINEVAGLRASIRLVQTPLFPIDLILFADVGALQRVPPSWRCVSEFERSVGDQSNCIVVEFEQTNATLREFARRYGYSRSLDYLAHPSAAFLDQYQLLLKTDCDTFVTPAFTHWLPNGEFEFYTGIGGYGRLHATQQQIVRWSERLGVTHRGYFNLGASWYASGRAIRRVGALALELTVQLFVRAFNDTTLDVWPRWYQGVASMYGQEMAVNHLVPHARPDIRLDYRTNRHASRDDWRGELLTSLDVAHLHCFQEEWFFSKAKFHAGHYRSLYFRNYSVLDPRFWAFEM
jgi:hypothetical protein